MEPSDLAALQEAAAGASRFVQRNLAQGVTSARYRALEPEWVKFCGASAPELEQGLVLIGTAAGAKSYDVDAHLDALAAQASAGLAGDRAIDQGMTVLTEVLGTRAGLRGNRDNYYDPANSRIQDVLRTGLGVPILLCSVAILVGRRLELPVFGIGSPGHFLGFYGDPSIGLGAYFDPFRGFRRLNFGEVTALLAPFVGSVDASMLQPVDDAEILARTLRNLVGAFGAAGDAVQVSCLERWIEVLTAP